MKPKKLIYLDHAAATPIDPAVLAAMMPYLKDEFGNPSSLYRLAVHSRQAIDGARARIAKILGAKSHEIIFTAGGTESINLAVLGLVRQFPGSRIVTTTIEHDAVLASVGAPEQEGHPITLVPVLANGIVDAKTLVERIDDQTVLVSVMYANNEIGTIQPVAEIAQAIAAIRSDRQKQGNKLPLYLHTDAAQAAGYLNLSVESLQVDLLSLNGSKIYGPKQTGILYVRTGTQLKPLVYGGGHERGLRSGTENVPGIVGLAKALELAKAHQKTESTRLSDLRDGFVSAVQKLIPDAVLNGDAKRRLPNNVNLTLPGVDGERLVLYLDKEGIAASTGSACSSLNEEPSHVLRAIGLSANEANASLRLTFGRSTTKAQLDYLLKVLPDIVNRLRQLSREERSR